MPQIFKRAYLRWWQFLKRYRWWFLPLAVWELVKDRFLAWANERIDQEAGAMLSALAKAIAYLASTPLAATISLAVLVLLALFIHSYWAEQKNKPKIIDTGKNAEEKGSGRGDMSPTIERDVWLLDAAYYIAFRTWKRVEWDELGGKLSNFMGVLEDIRQRALDGDLPVWGREGFSGPMQILPESYWKFYGFDYFGILKGDEEDFKTEIKEHVSSISIGVCRSLKTSRAKVEQLWPGDEAGPVYWTLAQTLSWIGFGQAVTRQQWTEDYIKDTLAVRPEDEIRRFDEAEQEFFERLRAEELTALGKKNNSQLYEEIPATYFLSDVECAILHDQISGGTSSLDTMLNWRGPKWCDVKIKRKDVLRLWPNPERFKHGTG